MTANTPIAIVGMACRFPDAATPVDLWENALAQRRAFRRIPAERLRAEDYFSRDPRTPDATYCVQAAVLEGFEFDRVKFRVSGPAFRAADVSHWLALDVASQALDDAGFPDGQGLPKADTGVVVANTLTGEFSRAGLMRYRWPYVRRQVESVMKELGRSRGEIKEVLARLEQRYKAPFPEVGEETLAGGLSNTIAGRICNHYDLKGGGYTVDGACASSLLAVATACASLSAGDVAVAVAGGVDLSLDPFEYVGFAKAGALAPDEMRVYDARSAGFWPGEGCGFAVLMRWEDAIATGARVHAVIRGWGISSDGSGGMTRPEEEGQLLALRRAYRRAGLSPASVAYFEGHGTGTAVGDATELRVLARVRNEAACDDGVARAAALGSIKANIGHTKAAAGMAGLLKATLAVERQVLPPTTACHQPHPELERAAGSLKVLAEPEAWPAEVPLRAGVSSMGFGGINAHVVLESPQSERRRRLSPREERLGLSPQDAEVFLMAADSAESLGALADSIAEWAPRLARSEMTDLAAELAKRACGMGPWRGAVVAGRPESLADGLVRVRSWLDEGVTERLDAGCGVFLSCRQEPARLGFLFPGQGSPAHLDGGAYRRRFSCVRGWLNEAKVSEHRGGVLGTDVAQPGIVRATLAGVRVLRQLGLEAAVGVGHSLGEFSALSWAGAWDEAAVLRVVGVRGRAMAALGDPTGAMAGIEAGADAVEGLLAGTAVTIAGFNSPRQTVISGPAAAVDSVLVRGASRGWRGVRLPVSHAFHSPLVAAARGSLEECLRAEPMGAIQRELISTITGRALQEDEDVRQLLALQVTSPVRFMEALAMAMERCDVLIEVGPGTVLGRLAEECQGAVGDGDPHRGRTLPVFSIDACGPSLEGLLIALGGAFVLRAWDDPEALFTDRHVKPFRLPWQPRFLANPCEQAPIEGVATEAPALDEEARFPLSVDGRERSQEGPSSGPPSEPGRPTPDTLLRAVREWVADRAELPLDAVRPESRLLADLHLNSITVGQLVSETARRFGVGPMTALGEFATATVAGVAQALHELLETGGEAGNGDAEVGPPAGIDTWLRVFHLEWTDAAPDGSPAGKSARRVSWEIVGPPGIPELPALADRLKAESEPGNGHSGTDLTEHAPVPGIVVWVPPEGPEAAVSWLLRAARLIPARTEEVRWVLVQHGPGAAGFARSLYLEEPRLHVRVITVPIGHRSNVDWVVDEARRTHGFREVRYNEEGVREEPRLCLSSPVSADSGSRLGPEDVVLVTGGGKGIAAESGLALARRYGVRLLLMGRARPEEDEELAANLARLTAQGAAWRYQSADVGDAEDVARAVKSLPAEWGPVTAVLHGAGTNVPQLVASLEGAAFERTLRPKVTGLRNVLAAVPADRLRLLVTFGSVIARSGLPGEADYAMANEWMTRMTEEFQRDHPQCRCLAIEWTVWSGVGMGERLGRVETLQRQGIRAITPEEGVEVLCRLIDEPSSTVARVVAGRLGELPTLSRIQRELPLHRFIERPLVFHPGIELVVEVGVSRSTDPYVNEHRFRGECLFPAVLGLEAMAQVAMAVCGRTDTPGFEGVEFRRPVVVPKEGAVRIRIASLVRAEGRVEVAVRCEATGFQMDHFRGTCVFGVREAGRAGVLGTGRLEADSTGAGRGNGGWRDPACGRDGGSLELPLLDVEREVYDDLLFHTGRFRRVTRYCEVGPHVCEAELTSQTALEWFASYFPAHLVLGDPAVRDAGIHSIQVCVPHAQILPTAVERIRCGPVPDDGNGMPKGSDREGSGSGDSRPVRCRATERERTAEGFTYDLVFADATGRVVEEWSGLRLRMVEPIRRSTPWPPALLPAHLTRRAEECFPGAAIRVGLAKMEEEVGRSHRTRSALRSVVGEAASVGHRPDGRPEIWGCGSGGVRLSLERREPDLNPTFAHCGAWTLAVVAESPAGCDLEAVTVRSEQEWQDLLGPDGNRLATLIASEAKEGYDVAATRVWAASEALRKIGMRGESGGLMWERDEGGGWMLLREGSLTVVTGEVRVGSEPASMVVALTVGRRDERREELQGGRERPCAPTSIGMS